MKLLETIKDRYNTVWTRKYFVTMVAGEDLIRNYKRYLSNQAISAKELKKIKKEFVRAYAYGVKIYPQGPEEHFEYRMQCALGLR